MAEPLVSKPKITRSDVAKGYITRYFVRMVSSNKITEVDKSQYDTFKSNPFYQNLQMNWVITGNDENTKTSDGKVAYGVKHQNSVLMEYYNQEMPGISGSVLRNPLEYFNGTKINTLR